MYGDGAIEAGSIAKESEVKEQFPEDGFLELADGHAAGDGVGVDDDVWPGAGPGEGHVLLWDDVPAGALLSVAGGELVADGGHAQGAQSSFEYVVSVAVFGLVVLVDVQ